jgi:hypothetical protein
LKDYVDGKARQPEIFTKVVDGKTVYYTTISGHYIERDTLEGIERAIGIYRKEDQK